MSYDLTNVNSKVIKEGEVKDKTVVKLTELAATDNREKLTQLTLIIPRPDRVCCWNMWILHILHLIYRVPYFRAKKRLWSPYRINISLSEGANILSMTFKVLEQDNILFDNIQGQSLKELSSNKCNSTITKTEKKMM